MELQEYYRRIFEWYRKNKNVVLEKYQGNNPEHPKLSNKIIENMPEPHLATNEDIVFVCRESLYHFLEWAYAERDHHGVWISAYAQHILDNFFPKENLEEFGKKSKLYSLLPYK